MPTRRQLIQKITLNADAASVTFSNIPQTYTDLQIVVSGRTTRTASYGDTGVLSINGSTSNFTNRMLYYDAGTVGSSSSATSNIFDFCTDGATSNTFGNAEMYLPNYSGSLSKSISVRGVNENNNATNATVVYRAILWSSTSAIQTLTLSSTTSSSIKSGSTFYLYGISAAPIINGGDVTVSGGYKYHTFRSTSTLQVVEPGVVEYLIVAGGGGGGGSTATGNGGGGGGAGGLRNGFAALAAEKYTITVGGGGNGGANTGGAGSTGSNSVLSGTTLTLTSGGGGGGGGASSTAGSSGGSGGGGSVSGAAGTASGSGTGNAGGAGGTAGGGGGGGAGGVGSAGSASVGGAGGNGTAFGARFYAGGGGGGMYNSISVGSGGYGGGGNGSYFTVSMNGVANTGGGGGGVGGQSGGATAFTGGSGGSGIVIIRYPYTGN